jgi:Zn-dependent M28 family amino/carboxypeptidase
MACEPALRIRPVILPTFCPGAWSSDHWSFGREGFPALMATDTAPLRYPYYHTRADTPDKINFSWLSQIVSGFRAVIADIANLAENARWTRSYACRTDLDYHFEERIAS